jgi:hypothetical protein
MRKAFTPSGAKDDTPDAQVLWDLLLHHRDKLRPLVVEDLATRRLAGGSETRRRAGDHRPQLGHEWRGVLKGYCPQAWALVGEPLSSPLAPDFLRRWPTLTNLKASRPTALKRFYPQHRVRRPEAMAQRLDLIRPARALTTDQAIVFVSRRQVERRAEEFNHLTVQRLNAYNLGCKL